MRPVTFISVVALAVTPVVVSAPVAQATSYAECAAKGAKLKDLTRRINAVQTALDTATSPKAEKRLRKKLKDLKAERARVSRWMDAHCTGPTP